MWWHDGAVYWVEGFADDQMIPVHGSMGAVVLTFLRMMSCVLTSVIFVFRRRIFRSTG